MSALRKLARLFGDDSDQTKSRAKTREPNAPRTTEPGTAPVTSGDADGATQPTDVVPTTDELVESIEPSE